MGCVFLLSGPSRTVFCLNLSSNEKQPGCGADAVKPKRGLGCGLHWRETNDQIRRKQPVVDHYAKWGTWEPR